MTAPAPPFPAPRILARGRPATDPACAGCTLLGVFRALRRAGLEARGAPGCDPDASPPLETAAGPFAAVIGAASAVRSPGIAVAIASAAGARLLLVADRDPALAAAVTSALAQGGALPVTVEAGDLAAAESTARRAADRREGVDSAAPLVALVALVPCTRGRRATAPFGIAPSRCNRCGACLGLGCAAISDAGGEAMVIDAATCTGCGLCAPLCRARAIAPATR